MSIGARDDNFLVEEVVVVVVVAVEVESEFRVSQRPEGPASQERLHAACKNAVPLAGRQREAIPE